MHCTGPHVREYICIRELTEDNFTEGTSTLYARTAVRVDIRASEELADEDH